MEDVNELRFNMLQPQMVGLWNSSCEDMRGINHPILPTSQQVRDSDTGLLEYNGAGRSGGRIGGFRVPLAKLQTDQSSAPAQRIRLVFHVAGESTFDSLLDLFWEHHDWPPSPATRPK